MQKSILYRFLDRVERVGNSLPHPTLLFLLFGALVVVISALVSSAGLSAIHPVSGEVLTSVNLLSSGGLRFVLSEMVKNYTGFAPLGTVLVAMLGFSLAEKSGLLTTLLRLLVLKAPKMLLIPAILLAGVMSHSGGDIGYVLLIPLAGLTFLSAGLHPVAGIAICFAGVSGGFAANVLLSTADPMLSGISQEAARILNKDYVVTPLSNYYFMATSSLLIIAVGTVIARKVTLPFLGDYQGAQPTESLQKLSDSEKRGLWGAAVVTGLLIIFLLLGLLPENGYLLEPGSPEILKSAALKGIVALIFLFGALPGLAFGFLAKTFKTQNDVVKAMQDAMATMAPYLVMVFFASQFIQLFSFSNMGLIFAIKGSEVLKSLGLGVVPLMLGFIVLTIFLDLLIGSASAKWALMAPIFVPMFMLLGVSPELSQASYRIADSVVNIISPLMPYFPLILSFANKYDPKASMGTVIALMLPYSIGFTIFWSLMLFAWISLKLPLGPGALIQYLSP